VRQVRDPLGHLSRLSFDVGGNLLAAQGPSGLTSTFNYDERGNLIRATDPLGNIIQTTFDPTFDRLTGATNPNGGRLAYGYDARGDLTAITYANGSRETFGYDAQGNVTT